MSSEKSATLALALLRTDGAGRVATSRLVERFGSYENIRQTPREQVLMRLPRMPNAEALVARIFDEAFLTELDAARRMITALAERRIQVITVHHPSWPAGLDDLERVHRSPVLYVFGDANVLARRSVAFVARPPLEDDAFELAQQATRGLLAEHITPIIGLQHGFDTVLCKLALAAEQPAIAVASAGLARIPSPMRPAAASLARSGGVLISPFPHDHGPFPHDDADRARLMAAMAGVVVSAGAPAGSAEARAVEWALDRGRPVFSTSRTDPEGVDRITGIPELDRLREAALGQAR